MGADHIEYLFGVNHCRGSLDCFTAYLDHPATPQEHWAGHILRFRITKKTPKRIYYVQRETPTRSRIHFVDRQKIEADGEIYRRGLYVGAPDSHLYLAEPPMPDYWDRGRFIGRHTADSPEGTCPARFDTLTCGQPPGHRLPHRDGSHHWYGPPAGPTPTIEEIVEHISDTMGHAVSGDTHWFTGQVRYDGDPESDTCGEYIDDIAYQRDLTARMRENASRAVAREVLELFGVVGPPIRVLDDSPDPWAEPAHAGVAGDEGRAMGTPTSAHWLTRYDPDDGEPYGEICHCEIDDDHDAAGNAMQVVPDTRTAETTGGEL